MRRSCTWRSRRAARARGAGRGGSAQLARAAREAPAATRPLLFAPSKLPPPPQARDARVRHAPRAVPNPGPGAPMRSGTSMRLRPDLETRTLGRGRSSDGADMAALPAGRRRKSPTRKRRVRHAPRARGRGAHETPAGAGVPAQALRPSAAAGGLSAHCVHAPRPRSIGQARRSTLGSYQELQHKLPRTRRARPGPSRPPSESRGTPRASWRVEVKRRWFKASAAPGCRRLDASRAGGPARQLPARHEPPKPLLGGSAAGCPAACLRGLVFTRSGSLIRPSAGRLGGAPPPPAPASRRCGAPPPRRPPRQKQRSRGDRRAQSFFLAGGLNTPTTIAWSRS
jgi:hypothetical protein